MNWSILRAWWLMTTRYGPCGPSWKAWTFNRSTIASRRAARHRVGLRPTRAFCLRFGCMRRPTGIGSARALARLCEHHTIYRWICGGVGVNHTMLSEFRLDSGEFLDRLLTSSLAALMKEGLITLDEVITDGTKVRAAASRSSMRRRQTLVELEEKGPDQGCRAEAGIGGRFCGGRAAAVEASPLCSRRPRPSCRGSVGETSCGNAEGRERPERGGRSPAGRRRQERQETQGRACLDD